MDVHQRRVCCLKGCLIPLGIIVCLYVVCIFWNWQISFNIPEIKTYVQIERIPFNNKARIYFSRTNAFENDYIEYNYYPDGPGIDIYYLLSNQLYVIDDGHITNIKTKNIKISHVEYNRNYQLNIKEKVDSTNWFLKPYLRANNFSFLKKEHYYISVWGTKWLEITDSKGRKVFEYTSGLFD